MNAVEHPRGGVPASQTLEGGTVGQSIDGRDTPRDGCGTADLKALALRLNERDRQRDGTGTKPRKSVPPASEQWNTFRPGVPPDWVAGVERLATSSPPRGIRTKNWPQLVEDCRRFLDNWGAASASNSWTVADLFGATRSLDTRFQPLNEVGRVTGLALMLDGGDVLELTDIRATVQSRSGAILTCPRWSIPGAVPLWKLIEGDAA